MRLIHGDCLDILPTLESGSVDAVVTDPPYGLEFMGKEWDKLWCEYDNDKDRTYRSDGRTAPKFQTARPTYVAGMKAQQWHQQWAITVLRVMKPGAYLLSFGGTRTCHRLICAIEDAGFEIRDCIMWLYGTGFPKGNGCLKPAWEPIVLARKPGKKVLPLGIDECRIPTDEALGRLNHTTSRFVDSANGSREPHPRTINVDNSGGLGRWPANVCYDGSDEVLEAFAAFGEKPKGDLDRASGNRHSGFAMGDRIGIGHVGDTGTAARFFYCAKASRSERGEGNTHPTVKPLSLMQWLVRLVTPPGGIVLDPFLGSGSTAVAALVEGRHAIGIEKDADYVKTAQKRLDDEIAKHPLFATQQRQGEE